MGNMFSDLISATCQAIFPPCLDCISKKLAYIRELEDNVNSLQAELQKLVEAKADVKRRVDIAEQRPQMQRLSEVQGWFLRVEAEETEVRELLRVSSQEIEKLCLGGYCSKNFKSSYKFGKTVAKKLQDVVNLKDEGAFDVVAQEVPEPAVDLIPMQPTIVGLQSTFDKVWKCFVEEEVGIIGIYGTGGVGKTTLLKQINNNFCNELQGFDVVIWVVVSKVQNFEKMQEDIGKKIGLFDDSWKNKSPPEKAGDIFKILRRKKFVLLLDDIWNWIDLTEVGVPIPISQFPSKLVFTTRSFEVCGSMKAHKHFKVEYLRDEEAWKLFEENLQSDVLGSDPDIPQLAKVVAKECGGLPLALVTISRAMSCKKTPKEWRYAANVLRNSASKFASMGTEVYPLLKFSYDSLLSDKIRSCLLYCSLYPEDSLIRKTDLIDCWIGEGFLDDSDGSEVYDQGYYIIGILVHACLLEEEKDYNIKLHDVIRDMVLWIANDIEKEKENYLVEACTGLTEAPEIGKWVGVRKISLMGNQIKILSQTPTCPDLHTLFLDVNKLSTINDDFFNFMSSLKVLNMSYNKFSKLPVGVSKLVSLQYLDLSCTPIQELSVELKTLTNLKCLRLEYMRELKSIPHQLISNLQRLHTLRMYDCGDYVIGRVEDSVLFDGGGEMLVEECDCLEYLNVLSITLRSYKALQRLLSSVKLQSCTQSLFLDSFHESTSFNILALATLKHLCQLEIREWEGSDIMNVGDVQKIREPFSFYSLQHITISYCYSMRDLTWIVFAPNLMHLFVNDCSAMEEIINVEKLGEVPKMMSDLTPFQKLQYLRLKSLKNLKSIFGKALPFPHLEEIDVQYCPKLNKLPLDSNSVKEHKIVIEGNEIWWKKLQWEDEATLNAFLPCFKSRWDPSYFT